MKLPTLNNFLEIKDKSETLGPSKIPDFSREALGEKKIFIQWEALNKIEIQGISKRFIRAFMIIGIFVGLLLIAMGEFFVLLIIGAVIFVMQALMKIPPEDVKYELNSFGVNIAGKLYYWDQLRRYFFITREHSEVIAIDTIMGIPGRLFLNFNQKDKAAIKEILNRYLHFMEEEPKTFLDDTYNKIMKKFSFDDTKPE